MPSLENLSEFTAWCFRHITGDEEGQAQIFLDWRFQAFVQTGSLDDAGLAAYGFSAKQNLLTELLAPNLEVAARIEKGGPSCLPAWRGIIRTRSNW